MMDTDTFLTTLYVMADDFCKYQLPPEKTPGPKPSLTRSEVVTLALSVSGVASSASEASTATPGTICARPSPPCPTVVSSTA